MSFGDSFPDYSVDRAVHDKKYRAYSRAMDKNFKLNCLHSLPLLPSFPSRPLSEMQNFVPNRF